MKRVGYLFVVFIILSVSCGNVKENKQTDLTDVKVVEPSASGKTKDSYNKDTNRMSTAKQPYVAHAGKPILLSKKDFLEKVMNYEENPNAWKFEGELPCLIDFYADWCRPCRLTAPILEELAKEYAGRINIYKIDTQKEKELAAVFGIQSLPTFLYCPLDGKPQLSSGIARSLEETKAMFVQNIESILLSD